MSNKKLFCYFFSLLIFILQTGCIGYRVTETDYFLAKKNIIERSSSKADDLESNVLLSKNSNQVRVEVYVHQKNKTFFLSDARYEEGILKGTLVESNVENIETNEKKGLKQQDYLYSKFGEYHLQVKNNVHLKGINYSSDGLMSLEPNTETHINDNDVAYVTFVIKKGKKLSNDKYNRSQTKSQVVAIVLGCFTWLLWEVMKNSSASNTPGSNSSNGGGNTGGSDSMDSIGDSNSGSSS